MNFIKTFNCTYRWKLLSAVFWLIILQIGVWPSWRRLLMHEKPCIVKRIHTQHCSLLMSKLSNSEEDRVLLAMITACEHSQASCRITLIQLLWLRKGCRLSTPKMTSLEISLKFWNGPTVICSRFGFSSNGTAITCNDSYDKWVRSQASKMVEWWSLASFIGSLL